MIQKIKGTYDVYGDLALKHDYVKKLFQAVCENYNYKYIETPIIERSELFHRGVGDTTDIVTKETYDFKDRGNRDLTLRPEGTAGVARSIIENKLYTSLPLKLYYEGSMFRYERPQKGRYRELRQMGVELYGSSNPISDIEVISLGYNFLKELGINNVKVLINSIGGVETRNKYKKELIKHFENNIDEFCDDCKERLKKNPLRILDCKVDSNNKLIKTAPNILDYLNKEEKENFEKIKEYLELLEIDYEVDNSLVRGLDYYTNLVFEFKTDIKDIGSIGGGGRYDNLLESLGGPSVPSVGFAFGFDRVIDVINELDISLPTNNDLDIYIMPLSDNELYYSLSIINDLRMCGYKVDIDLLNKSIKGKFKESEKYNAKYIVIIGEDEVNNGVLTVKDTTTKEEIKISQDELLDYFDMNI